MPWRFNPFTGNLDLVDTTAAAGSNTQVQFNDGGSLAGDSGLTFNKTTNALTVGASTVDGGQAKVFGDINLDDGGSFTTTVQCVTPTANRTISFPDATGTVALVAGSSGQLVYNNAGSNAGATGSVVDSSGNVTIGGLTTLAGSPSANNTSGVLINGTWRTGASSNNPQLLLNPTGTTLSTTWSPSGTGIGVNAPASFGGNLLDLQVNGTSQAKITSAGAISGGAITCTSIGIGANNPITGGSNNILSFPNSSISIDSNGSVGGFNVNGNGYIGFAATTPGAISGIDATFRRDAANTLAQRNGTNAQTFRVYNTFTDASNYERGFLRWNSNVFEVGPEAAGTGTARPMRITAATLKLPNLPTYADNAAATTGGLVAGDVYKTATGELRITV